MKKVFLFLIVPIVLQSCSFPSYVFENQAQTTGVDFTKGKWLLNEIDAPAGVAKKLTDDAVADFSELLGSRLNYVPNTRGLLLPQKKIGLNPDKNTLKKLQQGTKQDYFINISASQLKNDLGSASLTPHKLNRGGENLTKVAIEIYDLNLLQVIYSQKVTASSHRAEGGNEDVHFSKSSRDLVIGAYKRLIKDINKRSVR
ncbi:MAG TPA: hypothetical protein VFR70_10615 [Flavobacterium sp.]|nr:hypothetical protein [Flavobacterium sp.]